MLRKIQELRILKAIIGLSKDPETTENVFFMADTMLDMLTPAEIKQHTGIIMTYPQFSELYEAKYSPPVYDIDTFSACLENTLAHAYGVFMRKHGYKAEWYPVREASDPLTYMRNRLYQTHDVIHTITGFSGNPFGEIGVQAFYLGQMPEQPLPCAVITSGFLRMLTASPQEKDKLMEVVHKGYEMGRNAQPVLFRKWEGDWDANINELRDRLGIKAFVEAQATPSGQYLTLSVELSGTAPVR